MRGFRAFAQHGVLYFNEAAYVGSGANVCARSKARERADLRFGADAAGVENRVRADYGVVIDANVLKDAAGADRAVSADARFAEKLDGWFDRSVWAGGNFRIDYDCFGKVDRRAGFHHLCGLSPAEDAIDIGEVNSRVASENLAGVGGDSRQYAFVAFAEVRDRVGEIKLAMRIFGAQSVENWPELCEREAIDARIYFANGALLRSGAFFLDDGDNAAFAVADDPAVAGWVIDFRGENGGGGFAAAVRVKQCGESVGSEKGGVAWKNDDQFCTAANGAARDLHGMPGAALGLLQDRLRTQGCDNLPDFVCLVADNCDQLRRFQRLAGSYHVFD